MNRRTLFLLSSILIILSVHNEASAATAPDPPTNLAATAISSTQINLFWNAPANDGGSSITGYKIEYKIGSGSYSILVLNTANTATSYSHTGLTTGQSYSYKISAINSIGTSSASTEASATPTSSSSGTNPGAPTGLTAIPVSPTQVNLSWTAPSNNGGYPITGYKIEYRVGSGSYSTLVSNTASTSTTYSHTGLTTNQVYIYRVYAITSFGTSENASAEAVAQPKSSSTLTVPSAPTGLTATAVSPTQINLSWTAPSNNGGAAITGYKIEYKIGSGSYSTLVSNTASTTTSYSHTGLTSGQSYVYRVSAINSIGTGSASAEASSTPTSSSSQSAPGAPTGLTAIAASPTQVNLSWSAPSNNGGSAITGYKIETKKGTGSFETLVSNSQSTTTSFSHTGLTTGTTYYYRVSAINAIGISPPSETSSTPKETTTPTLTATAVSPTTISLSWVPPSQTYKQSISGYKIQEKIDQDTFKIIVDNTGSSATTYTVTGLTTGITHTYVVSAYFTLGASPVSNEATATPTTTSAPPVSQPTTNPPGAPTGLTASSVSATQVNLSWSAPSNNGGSTITGYKIEVRKGSGSFEALTSSTQNSTTKYSHTNLITGTTYYYRVYTINSVGISSPSSESSATPTTASTPPPKPATSLPGTPTLAATLISPTQVNLHWSTPSTGGAVTGYKIEYKIGSNSYLTLTKNTDSTTYSHTGLLANTYSYRIYAINSAGTSSHSNEVSVTTQPQTPPEPEEPACGLGTILNDQGVCVIAEPEPEPEPETPGPMKTHIPGFPDPNKDPQYYINRYNSDSAYMEWFDRNFPDNTIYEVVGVPEPEPQKIICGTGTHLENGICVLDKKEPLGGGCLIATATYGTELAPQVQHLREIRENTLLTTNSGMMFLSAFNDVYYSFSPIIADWERQNPYFKEAVKLAITPMLSTLAILNHAGVDSEQEMLGYGMGIILLNAGMYLGVPALLVLFIKNKSKRISNFGKRS